MATNFTGDPTATGIVPDAGPQPETAPVVSIPSDLSDPTNVASISQALRTLTNWSARHARPRAKSGEFGQPVLRFRNARGHTRFHVDHQGMPAGRIMQWRGRLEDAYYEGGTTGANPVAAGAGWRALCSNGGFSPGLPTAAMPCPSLMLWQEFGSTGAYSHVLAEPQTVTGTGVAWALEWESRFIAGDSGAGSPPATRECEFSMGMWRDSGWNSVQVKPLPTTAANQHHILIYRDTTSPYLKVQSRDAAGAQTTTTTVSVDDIANVWTRYRLEFAGADASDSSADQAHAYVNGALVATHTGHLATPPAFSGLAPGFSVYSSGVRSIGTDYILEVAAPRLTIALYPADVI